MPTIRALAGQTVIYGLSSIVGRFLNYLLVPLHTAIFVAEQYGIITEMYAYVAFLVVLLTYGMEIAYFRYASRDDQDRSKVYGTSLISLLGSSTLFILLAVAFAQPIAEWLRYPDHIEYVIWFAIIVGLDAVSTIPLARLREENKATRFAVVNLANIAVNISLNVFFIGYLMPAYLGKTDSFLVGIFGMPDWLLANFYDHNVGVGYVFIANLIASIVKFLLLTPTMLRARFRPDPVLLRRMLSYAFPLLIAGLMGIVNETIDRIMLKRMLIDSEGKEAALTQVGIYGAVYKIAILLSLFVQAFRYAAEPFFFAREKDSSPEKTYSRVMTYFSIIASGIFLGVLLYLDLIKHFLRKEEYWQGLHIVPILLMAYVFYGFFYNLSFWYKLTERTRFGAYISGSGAVVTIVGNYLLIPHFGYVGSAWSTFACYALMVLASYALSRRYYPIQYQLGRIGLFLGIAIAFYGLSEYLALQDPWPKYGVHTLLFLSFLGLVLWVQRDEIGPLLKSKPYAGSRDRQ
jgi:O-antigen/teichoic acid export membrane protein